jgi:hypothetical protein
MVPSGKSPGQALPGSGMGPVGVSGGWVIGPPTARGFTISLTHAPKHHPTKSTITTHKCTRTRPPVEGAGARQPRPLLLPHVLLPRLEGPFLQPCGRMAFRGKVVEVVVL